jgi:transcriptional regulator with XRE-family HTH domain
VSQSPLTTPAQLGAAIRLLRESHELTIEALAAEAEIHWTYLSEIEGGKHNPSWEVVSRLATVLRIDLGELAQLAADQER